MPKVKALTSEKKIFEEVTASIDSLDWQLHRNKISYTKIADLLNLTPAAVSSQFRRGSISYPVYVVARMLLEGEI